MAAHLLVLYNPPADAAAFDSYYRETHVPLVKKIPGLRRFSVSRKVAPAGGGATPFHLIAVLEFDSLDALGSALGSPEGAAAAGDLKNFAGAGATLLTYESVEL